MNRGVMLVGDGIENPANALTMMHAAQMFGAACRFRGTKGLERSLAGAVSPEEKFPSITSSELQALHSRVVVLDNLASARDLYGFHAGREFALVLGNERRGVSHEFAKRAKDLVQIPMQSRRMNCLNVAAAAAVALYYLCGQVVGPMASRRDPRSRRPELLLLGAGDQFELGSTIRSAAAFGWERAFIEDRHGVWFGCDRAVRSEGRAAARRGRNDIVLVPCLERAVYAYPRVTVITCRGPGVPLHRASLAGGARHLVVIPDESRVDPATEDWSRMGARVELVHLRLPAVEFTYHYRLAATIGLAEISRQVGRRIDHRPPAARRLPIYDHKLADLVAAKGELVSFEDLMTY